MTSIAPTETAHAAPGDRSSSPSAIGNAVGFFRPPDPSRATRRIARTSRGSLRASLVATFGHQDQTHDRIIRVESRLELETAYVLLAQDNLEDLWDQPPAVSYRDATRRERRHVFDFLALLQDGERVAVAVKPHDRVVKRNFRQTLEYIARDMPRNFADRVCLVTEKSFSRAQARNAELIHNCRRVPDAQADQQVLEAIQRLHGATTIGEIVKSSSTEAGTAFRAMVRQIGKQRVRVLRDEVIGYSTRIARRAP